MLVLYTDFFVIKRLKKRKYKRSNPYRIFEKNKIDRMIDMGDKQRERPPPTLKCLTYNYHCFACPLYFTQVHREGEREGERENKNDGL